MNNDLISRQAAIAAIEFDITYAKAINKETGEVTVMFEKENKALEDAVTRIKLLPSAQPDIVRCKDCEHWDTTWQNDFAPNYHYCPFVDGTRRDDFYCADAERREVTT